MQCPKCSYLRKPTDEAPDWQCPSCGVAYAKVISAQQEKMRETAIIQEDEDEGEWEQQERLDLAARGQKMLIHGLLYGILLSFIFRALTGLPIQPDLANAVILIVVGVYTLIGAVKICTGLDKGQSQKILFMVLMFVPLFSPLAMLYLSQKATRMLRKAGFKVGLLGAKL